MWNHLICALTADVIMFMTAEPNSEDRNCKVHKAKLSLLLIKRPAALVWTSGAQETEHVWFHFFARKKVNADYLALVPSARWMVSCLLLNPRAVCKILVNVTANKCFTNRSLQPFSDCFLEMHPGGKLQCWWGCQKLSLPLLQCRGCFGERHHNSDLWA